MPNEIIKEATSGVISHSVKSVFDGINSWTEALDIFKKYQRAQENLTKGIVEKVKILGMSEPLPLAEIYYPTKISTTIHRRLYAQEWHSVENHKDELRRQHKGRPTQDGEEYINNNLHTVILAGPGSGKTTFLKHLALINSDKELFKSSKLAKRKTPFYLHLPLLNPETDDIVEHLTRRLQKDSGDFANNYITRKLEKGDAIVLLDSLDEVPEKSKKAMIEKLQQFCERFTKATIVISCRIADYEQPINNCYEVEISRLSDDAVKKIVTAWFRGDKEKSKTLLRHLKNDSDLLHLTSTPLLLSLLCIQFKNDLDIPRRKVELYKRCVDALLKTWDTSRNFRRDTKYSNLTDDRKIKLFEKISRHYIDNEFAYIFDSTDLEIKVGRILEFFGTSRNDSKDVIREIESHHGILERNSAETFIFCHPSFQEYFCARETVASRSEIDFVKKNLENPSAHQIITFIAALVDNSLDLAELLREKSVISGIKHYPAMARRTVVLHLLYKVLNSGVMLSPEDRERLNQHLVDQQFEISEVYRAGGVYPFAVLEPDGIRHFYYYTSKRQTLYSALQPLRKFANEALLSPSLDYAKKAIDAIERLNTEIESSKRLNMHNTALSLCLTSPLATSRPDFVMEQIEFLQKHTPGAFFTDTLKSVRDTLNSHYI